MMKIVSHLKVATLCCILCVFLGCSHSKPPSAEVLLADSTDTADSTSLSSDPLPSSALASSPAPGANAWQTAVNCAWIPYWDYASAINEIDEIGDSISTLIGFAAIFNSSDEPFLLQDMLKAQTCLDILYSDDHTIYLSVVNDIELEDSVYDNKSSELLWRLLGSDATINAHIEDLMTLMRETGAEGLEIDYEAIQSDVGLWQRFIIFVERLNARTVVEGYALRVVLGWDSVEYVTFPEGPQYSIMCYNLHGFHSNPGPKADSSFLKKVFTINRALPGQPSVAFATGGFDWCSDGSIVALTQTAAIALRSTFNVPLSSISRDPESATLFFSYTDDVGLSHEVWYADGATLSFWRSLALDAGYVKFDLFRLGGNSIPDLIEFLKSS